ncbi:glycosyltransferase [Actinoplanes sp. CA-030573]|uniref:glycosyltransferase n=1 Tax=Actinoplanes sp. CA-030573 TaxID=3239898 RepID=UPI003D8ED808
MLDVVVPVFNEEHDLPISIRRLDDYLTATFPYPYRITIADNASTDATALRAAELAAERAAVTAVRLEQKGRGNALRTVWATSDAPVLAYMDVDLSTDLAALLPLVAPLVSGHSDIAIGTRLARGARVVRGLKRQIISRGYNLIVRASLWTRFSDAQCGFKAIRADAASWLLPLVANDAWFFDTELLVLAERAGLRIHEVPVDWVDDPDSRVNILRTALDDLKGIWRIGTGLLTGDLRHRLAAGRGGSVPTGLAGQLARFAGIGLASTLTYLALFAWLAELMHPLLANAVALLVTAIGNTALNRRITFGMRGRAAAARQHLEGLVLFAAGLLLTSGIITVLNVVDPQLSRVAELAFASLANAAVTISRFLAMRVWVFSARRNATDATVNHHVTNTGGPDD